MASVFILHDYRLHKHAEGYSKIHIGCRKVLKFTYIFKMDASPPGASTAINYPNPLVNMLIFAQFLVFVQHIQVQPVQAEAHSPLNIKRPKIGRKLNKIQLHHLTSSLTMNYSKNWHILHLIRRDNNGKKAILGIGFKLCVAARREAKV